MPAHPSLPDLNPVDELAEESLTRRRRGERPTPGAYAAQHPEHAQRILELFPALELMEGLKPAAEDHTGLSNDELSDLIAIAVKLCYCLFKSVLDSHVLF